MDWFFVGIWQQGQILKYVCEQNSFTADVFDMENKVVNDIMSFK